MKFLDFLDNSLQETRKKEADYIARTKGALNPVINGKIECLRFVLFFYVGSFKWLSIPGIFISYFLVCLGLKKKPIPVLKLEAESKKEATALAEKIKADLKANGSALLAGKKDDLITEAGEFPPMISKPGSDS